MLNIITEQPSISRCRYCGAETSDLGTHYGRECPEVAKAFGPAVDRRRRPTAYPPHCLAAGCTAPVFKKGRCLPHYRAKRQHVYATYQAKHHEAILAAARGRYRLSVGKGAP